MDININGSFFEVWHDGKFQEVFYTHHQAIRFIAFAESFLCHVPSVKLDFPF